MKNGKGITESSTISLSWMSISRIVMRFHRLGGGRGLKGVEGDSH